MKFKWTVLIFLIMFGILLTACGINLFKQSSQTTYGSVSEKIDGSNTKFPGEDSLVQVDEEVIRLSEDNITYSVEGIEHKETGFLNTSLNQPFSLYVFEDFLLESEEPGKDVILHKEHQDVFMRIELFTEDTDFTIVEKNTIAQLKVVSERINRVVRSKSDPMLEGATMLQASNSQEWVQTLLVSDHEEYPNMKLTIHAPKEDEVVGKLLAMAKTISYAPTGR